MVKISVIVPVYNNAHYVKRCVDRLLQQSYRSFEIILVDDGSEDGSAQICDLIQQKYSRVHTIHKQNGGVSSARNVGMQCATGEYVCFLDCDDWLDDNYFELCVGELAEHPVDIVLTPYLYEYGGYSRKVTLLNGNDRVWEKSAGEGNEILRRLFGPIGSELQRLHAVENYNPVWAKLYRTNLVKGISFVNMDEILAEDLWYNISVFYAAQSYGYVSSVYYHYNRDNNNSITRSYREGVAEQYRNLYAKMAEFIRAHHLPQIYTDALENRKVANLITLSINCYSSQSPYSIQKQTNQMFQVLSDREWETALMRFDCSNVTIAYKIFLHICKQRRVYLLGLVTKITMATKRLRERR